MRSLLTLCVCFQFLCFFPSVAQTVYSTQDTAYINAVERGLVFLNRGQCQPCLDAYQDAFKISKKSVLSAMRAAMCAFQCGQHSLAKTYIQQAVDIEHSIAEDVWVDRQLTPEFDAVRATQMNRYVDEIFTRKDSNLGLNVALKKELATIYDTDQQPRSLIDSLSQTYGSDSYQLNQLWKQIQISDSINLAKIEKIVERYGYPGKTLVGVRQSNTAWLVIQHAPVSVQEKYLPLLQKAANAGEMEKSNMALLIDRIRVFKGQKQLYGSQVTVDSAGKKSFDPIEDEANVNKRRAEMGLEPLEEYAKQFGFEYKPIKN